MNPKLPPKSQNSHVLWFTPFYKSLKILLAVSCIFLNIKGFSQVANYTFISTAGTYTPITGATTAHASGWDNGVTTVPLGFNFNYNGIDYNTCSINTNGFITFGTTVSAINLYTPISAATAYTGAISALGFNLISNSSTITYITTGTAPNRTFVVQWTNARRYSGSAIVGDYSFQIRLSETSNIINIVYGTCSTTNGTSYDVQVGLRGAASTDYNNRSFAANAVWDNATTAGTVNTATVRTNNIAKPNPGRTFTWSPNYKASIISANTGSAIWCAGETRDVTVTIKNTGSAPWTDGGGKDFNVGVKWNQNGTSWNDYHVRTDAKNLAPGNTDTFTLPLKASENLNGTYGSPLAAGSNNLTFDLVYEGQFWFGSTAGNSVFTTPAQTITNSISSTAASPVPANTATNVCYAGIGATSNISWSAAAGAASYDVYFGAGTIPGSVTSNVTGTNYTTGTLLPNTTYYWKIVPRNSCGITTGTPITWSFTTSAAPCYCTPAVTNPNNLYINKFQFVGTLNDNAGPNISVASGYSDFTSMTPVVMQPQGAVLNIVASALGSTGQPASGYWKAWVDYNGNGIYETTEQVYSLTAFSTESLTFGFVIPASTPIGKYRFRLRTGEVNTFDACSTVSRGETEDYLFEVVADCAAKINTSTLKDAQRCGTGTVTLTASGSGTGIRWYAAASGGTPLFDGANFTTPVIAENTRTTYYVVAYNGTCESVFRIPVTAIANQGPTVNFGTVPSFCAPTTSGQMVSANNGVRLDVLLSEPFDSGLGAFQQSAAESGYLDLANAYWINRPSPYIPPSPPYEGLAPALSSGYTGGNFAMTNTDVNRAGQLLNRITLTNNLDTRNFNNLKLDFDLYYFTLITAADLENYFSVDYSINGGSTWINLQTIKTNKGNPNIWEKISLDLPSSVLNLTTVKIRFSSFSYGKSGSFKESIAAVDNVKISGIKDENSQFSWTSPLGGILFESDCTTPLNTTKASTICVKPSGTQFENNASFSITASASFSSGCPATGTIVIANDLKVFDTTSSSVWNNAPNWKPSAVVPTADKCVVIKKPVNLVNGDGFAKNIIIAPGGSLNIKKDRTLNVTDFIKNETTPLASNETNFVLETDGNLIQTNGGAPNSGRMTAQRNITGLRYNPGSAVDYVYWSAPVLGQKTKGAGGFSPGTPNNRFYQYRESNDRFYETADLTFTPGKGYAVQAETNVGSAPTNRLFEFKGTPNNGDISIGILKSPNGADGTVHGYNLVGNPYPSNINFEQLHYGNAALIWGTAWFWTNNVYTASQMGSGYTGNNYAIWNGAGGVGATSPYVGGKIPNGIVKVGQAFIVQAKSAGNLNFKNQYDDAHVLRVKTTGDFYSKNSAPKNRFWISLLSPANLSNSQLIAYVPGATDGFEQDYDADSFDNYSDMFYSVLPEKRLLIQGRGEAFSSDDVVALGANFFQNGTYTIALETAEGIFDGNQNIYLKDRQTGMITNLSQGSYSFTALKGDTTGRFEIIYKPEAVLTTGSSVKEQVIVYRDATDFVIKSPKVISTVEVYDQSGKLIVILKPMNTTAILDASALANSGYILKIKTKDGEVTSRKIVR